MLENVGSKSPKQFLSTLAMHPLSTLHTPQGSTTLWVKGAGGGGGGGVGDREGLYTWAGAGGAPQRERGRWAAWRVPLPSGPLLGSGCIGGLLGASAPEGWGRREKAVCGEAGRTHLAPCGMKS